MRAATRDRQGDGRQPVPGADMRCRTALLRSSALQAAALAILGVPMLPIGVAAQNLPAPNQLPTGGQVFTGTAGIAASGSTLNVNQASQRAGINWQSFSIGSQATVAIHTPGAQALTINRVVGPDPSVIAGQLTSNGQVVITNQSGVTFTQGSQVNVQSLIASAPGISEANAKAGRLVFDQAPRPGAAVANHGTITVGQTGLAALVAPQVANSGAIRAHLGKVVLAGAAAHTVDLYGDGLLSIDVSKQVTTVPVGPDGKPVTALVTNTGTILADGGSIVLTAKAVDGLVTTLVDAGGTISAATRNGTPGRIVIAGTGGDVILRGMVAARGETAGAKGGQIEVNAPGHKVALAAGAVVDASGRAGGGVVAFGTTLARAKGGPSVTAPTAKHVTIADGAKLAADATGKGDGGIVTVLSKGGATIYQGEISATGGPGGGNGGAVEVSGDYLALLGTVNVRAPMGAVGSVLLDPNDITIVTDGTAPSIKVTNLFDAPNATTILDYTQINKLSGDVTLRATGSITMNGAMNLTVKDAANKSANIASMTMLAIGDVTINQALTGSAGIILAAGASFTPAGGEPLTGLPTAKLTINAAVTSTKSGTIGLGATGGGITINSLVSTAGGTVNLLSTGGVTEAAGGKVIADTLIGTVTGNVAMGVSTGNKITTLGAFAVTTGTLTLADSVGLGISGPVSGVDLVLSAPTINVTGSVAATGTASLTATPGTIDVATTATVSGGVAVVLNGAGGITSTGTLVAGTLSGGSTGGSASLTGLNTSVGTLGDFNTKLDFTLDDVTALKVTGNVVGANVTLTSKVEGTAITVAGTVQATGTASLSAPIGALDITATGTVSGLAAVTLTANDSLSGAGVVIAGVLSGGITAGNASLTGANKITTLGSFSAGGDVTVANSQSLAVTGPVSADNITLSTSGGPLTLSGTVDAGTGVLDLSAGGGITQSGGKLIAGLLQSSAGAGGDVALGSSANAITALGAFAVTGGGFALTDGVSLSVSGAVAVDKGSAITLTADQYGFALTGSLDAGSTGVVSLVPLAGGSALTLGGSTAAALAQITAGTISLGGIAGGGGTQVASIDITGTVTTAAVLELHSAGTITQSGGTLSVGGLQGSASGVSIEQAGNVIPVLGAFTISGGNFRLTDSVPLDVTGTLNAANVVLTDSAGGIALTISGSVTGTAVTLNATGALALAGTVDVGAGTLDLNATTGVSQTGGAITAGTLLSSLGVTGDVTLAGTTNAVATLGGFTVTKGSFALADGSALGVSGAVGASDVTLSAPTLDVTGSIAATGTASLTATAGTLDIGGKGSVSGTTAVSLSGAAGITSSGTLSGGTLSGGSTLGGASLSSANNGFTALDDFATKLDFALTNASALTVTGTVSGRDVGITANGAGKALSVTGAVQATGTANLAAQLGAIDVTGTISGTQAVVLQANGALTGTGVVITAALSGGSSTAGASLTGKNQITSLGAFSALDDVVVVNGQAMSVAGPVSGANIALSTTAGLLLLSGTVDAGIGTLALGSGGGITQSGGRLNAGVLQSAAGTTGTVALGSTLNTIGALGAFSTGLGSFALANASPMVVNGAVKVDDGKAIALTADSFSFGLLGALNAGSTGVVSLVPLTGGAALTLSGATLGDLAFITAGTISLGGIAGGGGTQAASVDIAANVTTAAVLELHATGAITQSAGTLNVGGLAGSAFGVSIEQPGNVIPALGLFTLSGGDFRLADGVALDVTGSLSAANIALSSSAGGTALTISGSLAATGTVMLTTSGGGMALTGSVNAGAGTLDLNSRGGISQTTGTLTAGVLLSSLGVSGNVNLGSGGNAISTLGNFAVAGGGFTLVNGGALGVTGVVGATDIALSSGTLGVTGWVNATGTASLTATTGGLGIASTGTVGGPTAVVLNGAGGISGGGVLIAGVLSGGSSGGGASLTGSNQVTALGDFKVKTDLVLNDASALTVSGVVGGANITLSSAAAGLALNITGTVDATGTASLQANAGTIALAGALTGGAAAALNAADAISGSGVLTAGILAGGVTAGGVFLNGANQVTTLGDFTTAQNFVLFNARDLAVSGTVGGANIGLVTTGGGITLSGVLNAGTIVSLNSVGGVSQSGGSIVAASLMSGFGVTGDVVLGAAGNKITVLAGFGVTGGSFSLTDAAPLSVAGTVSVTSGGTITLSADTIAFAGGGSLNAGTGVVALVPLTGTAVVTMGGAAVSGIVVGGLNQITAGTISLGGAVGGGGTQAASIDLTGNVTTAAALELHTTGAIVQSGGTLSVGSLSGNASGVSIEQAGNVIPALGAFTLGGGDFRLADSVALDVTGTLSAANVVLSDSAGGTALTISGSVAGIDLVRLSATGGALALNGVVSAPTLDIAAFGGVSQGGGSLSVGTLLSSGGAGADVTLGSATNQIDALGNFTVTGGALTLRDSKALVVSGAVSATSVALADSATGTALAITGSITGTAGVALVAMGGTVGLAGTVDAGTGTLDLSAGALNQTGGRLAAGQLVSGLGVTGDVALGQAGNAIAGLGGFTVTGGSFALTDSVPVSVTGPVAVESGRSITLTGDGLAFGVTGSLNAGTGVVSLVPLTASAVVTLGGAAAGIAPGDLSRITAGTISLGGIAGGGGVLAQRIDLTGNATTAAVLELHTSGAIVQSAGALSVGSLTGEAFGVDLQSAGNVIPVLGPFTVNGGDFRLADSVALDLPGTLGAANIALTDSSGGTGLTIGGLLTATGTVALAATGGTLALNGVVSAAVLDLNAAAGVSQGGGSLVAGTLLSSTGVTGPVTLAGAANQIGAIGGFTVTGGDFTLAGLSALNVTGALSAANVVLTDAATGTALTISGSVTGGGSVRLSAPNGGVALNGVVSAATLDLNAAGGVSQVGGSLSIGTLLSSGGVTGAVSLVSATNQVGTIGGFAVTGGDFTLTDAQALTVTGALSATNVTLSDSASGAGLTVSGSVAGANVVLVTTGGTLTLNGVVTAATLDLGAAGGISQGGGSLSAATLLSSGGVTGDVALTGAGNRIGALGGFTVTGGDFTLVDASALAVSGVLSAAAISLTDLATGTALTVSGSMAGTGTVALATPAGALTLNGVISAAVLDLNAATGVSQAGGSLVAGTLLSSVGVTGAVSLVSTTNRIGAIGGFVVTGGDFMLTDASALNVTGALSAANVGLTDSATGVALTVSGSVAGTGTVALATSAGAVALGGMVTAATLDLHATSGVNQSGGSLSADTLLSSGGVIGTVSLASVTNRIATLAGFTVTGGGFTLVDAEALDVAGPLSAANIALRDSAAGTALTISGSVAGTGTVALAATGGVLALNGVVSAATLDLDAAGGVRQGGGSLSAGILLSSAGVTGTVSLTGATNRIGTLGGFAVAGGDFTLADTSALTISGALSAANVTLIDTTTGIALTVSGSVTGSGTVTLATPSGALALNGVVNAATLDLDALGGVNQVGGSVIADVLRSGTGVSGGVMLARSTNQIGAIGDFTVTGGDFTLADAAALTVTGSLGASNITLTGSTSGAALTVSGSVAGTGTVSLAASAGALALNGVVSAATLDLNAKAGISQGGGSLVAGTLLSSTGVSGRVALLGTGNQIATLGGFTVSGGDFQLADAAALNVSGAVSATNVTLSDSAAGTALTVSGSVAATGTVGLAATVGALVLNGDITAGTLNLEAADGASQGGGAITAGTLLSGAGVTGDVVLAGVGNRINVLDGFTASGNFALNDAVALAVSGPVSAANISLTDTAGGTALTIGGTLSTTGAAGLTVTAGALALNGTVMAGTLELNAANGISQGGGSLAVGTLLSGLGVTGNVTLASATNRIATLGAFTVTGGSLSLTDATALTIASAGATPAQVAAENLTLVMTGAGADGNIAITGAIVVPGTMTVTTSGTIQRSGGAFVVGTLTGSAVTLADFGTGANLTTLGAFTVTGSEFALGNAQPLTITGPLSAEFFRITATGSLTLAGNITTLGETRRQQGLGDLTFASSDQALKNPLPTQGSYLAVEQDGETPASFTQSGPVTISTAGGAISTLRIQLLSNGGTITLGDLTAPTTDLLLFPGGTGVVTGTGLVDLYGLLVAGRGGKSDLSGKIATIGGEAAAHLADITPIPDASYRFNACPIGSVNCVLIPVGVLPPTNPLHNFVIGEARGDEDDLDLILPNVADEDY